MTCIRGGCEGRLSRARRRAEAEVAIVRAGVDMATVVGPTAAKGTRRSTMLLEGVVAVVIVSAGQVVIVIAGHVPDAVVDGDAYCGTLICCCESSRRAPPIRPHRLDPRLLSGRPSTQRAPANLCTPWGAQGNRRTFTPQRRPSLARRQHPRRNRNQHPTAPSGLNASG